MYVISHQGVRQELKAVTLRVEAKPLQVYGTVFRGEKYILTSTATLGDVMG